MMMARMVLGCSLLMGSTAFAAEPVACLGDKAETIIQNLIEEMAKGGGAVASNLMIGSMGTNGKVEVVVNYDEISPGDSTNMGRAFFLDPETCAVVSGHTINLRPAPARAPKN